MKQGKPTTPSQRHSRAPSGDELSGNASDKKLTKGFRRGSGRNSDGRITMRHRGGGHKRTYRFVDFIYDKKNIPATVESIEYDPNRSAYIALVCYNDGERRYVIAHDDMEVGDEIITSEDASTKAGNRLPLSNIPVGTSVYNIELKPNSGAKIARSAGNSAEVMARDGGYVHLKMPSTEIRKVPEGAWATIGEVSNPQHNRRRLGKAGRSRWLGRRPKVRGVAQNAVDHPFGGGEGRTGRGTRKQKTKWGRPAGKGEKTRKKNKYSDKLIVERRKKKKKKK